MKVEVHDLKHEKWFLEAEPTDTIGTLKKINAELRSFDDSSSQKMIYSGKILKDTDTLEQINYAEGKGFIVCMVSRLRKPTSKAPSASPSPATKKEEAEKPKEAEPKPSEPAQPEASGASNAASELSGPSALASGEHFNTVLNNIMDMGYPRGQVIRALRQAYNNPDRAVEYLVMGQVPEEEEEAPSGETAESSNVQTETSGDNQVSGDQDVSSIDRNLFDAAEEQERDEDEVITDDEVDFHELLGLDDEQLNELRAAVRQNPHELLRLLDPLVRNDPHVAETLINNLDRFMWFLQTSGEANEAGNDSEMPVDSETQPISITPEEEAVIHRLMELGFEFDVVALAYLACEKDEQLTANYLLEHGNDD